MNNRISRQEEKAPAPHRTILRMAAVVFIAFGLLYLLSIVLTPLAPGHPTGAVPYIEGVVFAVVMVGGGALLYIVAPRMMD